MRVTQFWPRDPRLKWLNSAPMARSSNTPAMKWTANAMIVTPAACSAGAETRRKNLTHPARKRSRALLAIAWLGWLAGLIPTAQTRRTPSSPSPLLPTVLSALLLLFSWSFTSGAAEPKAAAKFKNDDCLDCHTDPNNTKKVNGQTVPVGIFPTNFFNKSIHAKLNCVDCHVGIKDLVHENRLPKPQCDSCHDTKTNHTAAIAEYATSIHGMSHTLGASGAANCWDCHGKHDMLGVKNGLSPVFKLNHPRTCATCHTNRAITTEYKMKYPDVVSQFNDSIHGRALLKMGLIVAPSCNDCHGVHDIKRGVDRDSPINHANVAKTCGKCHVKIEEVYNKSVHGQLLAKGDKRGPVCTDCPPAHDVETPKNGHFKMASDKRCGKCHEDRLEHYRDTYHGKAMALGKPNVASEVAAC